MTRHEAIQTIISPPSDLTIRSTTPPLNDEDDDDVSNVTSSASATFFLGDEVTPNVVKFDTDFIMSNYDHNDENTKELSWDSSTNSYKPKLKSLNKDSTKFRDNGDATNSFKMTAPIIEEEVINGALFQSKDADNYAIVPTLLNLYTDKKDRVMVHKVLAHLKNIGIKPFLDIRVEEMMHRLSVDPDGLYINSEIGVKKFVSTDEFKIASQDCTNILNQALGSNLIIPEFKSFCNEIKVIYDELKDVKGGKNADYIPQLSRVNPTFFGVAICTIDGQRCSFGDTGIPFCIQSGSKALNYAIAVNEYGPGYVHKYLGKEPSGVGFNQIGLDKNGLPHNPMINPGGISCCSLMWREASLADRFDFTTNEYKKMAGDEFIGFSNATFLSEKSKADRNFAIGYYLKEKKAFPENTNLHETLDFYFQLCAVEATADSASVISATLANGGVCPTTREVCISPDAVRNTLSLMLSCGMYDYSGEWAFEVGLPAKSGVAGSVFIVIPGVMGICVWSPPLDPTGNSHKGILFAKKLIEKFSFHQFDVLQDGLKKLDPRLKVRGETPAMQINNILSAASMNDMVLLARYHEVGINLDVSDYDNRTALHLAACNGHLNVVKFLVKDVKMNINVVDRWQGTPLDEAIRYEFQDVQRFLEKRGAVRGDCVMQKSKYESKVVNR